MTPPRAEWWTPDDPSWWKLTGEQQATVISEHQCTYGLQRLMHMHRKALQRESYIRQCSIHNNIL